MKSFQRLGSLLENQTLSTKRVSQEPPQVATKGGQERQRFVTTELLGNASKSDLAKECGYVSDNKNGGERINFTAFYEALLNAKGVDLGGGDGKVGKGGRKLSYIAKVQPNGNLLVGNAYTKMLDLNPGDAFDIKLGKKAIRLIPVGGNEEEGEE